MNLTDDFRQYHALRHRMTVLLRSGQRDTAEFDQCWHETETIKNRHGGFPPVPDDVDAMEQEMCEMAVESGLR